MEKTSMNLESNFQLNLTDRTAADQKTSPAQRLKLPHAVIVRAPGLLPMLYTLSELEAELGVPHQRDARDHVWIDGRQLAAWVQTLQATRSRRPGLNPDEAYCFRCNRPVKLAVSTVQSQGKQALLCGICPECGTAIHRGIRHG
jgi:hypothetical protein